jgi:hypothetical protein
MREPKTISMMTIDSSASSVFIMLCLESSLAYDINLPANSVPTILIPQQDIFVAFAR